MVVLNRFALVAGILLILSMLWSCAEQRPLMGGPSDTKAPGIDSTRYSTPNGSLFFKEKEIILTFDEWIVLKDANTQVLISPPLIERPEIKLKQKSVLVKFKEPLRENTTYTIQFGETVRDITEGNIAENLRFVFSTGAVLDSLSVSGQVVDAITAEGMKQVWVMLYDLLEDSIPRVERPFYLTKTNDQGIFKLENLKSDSFQIFALKDNNNNYKFDLTNESIAFMDSFFVLTDTMPAGFFRLRMFQETEKLVASTKKQLHKGAYKIAFNQKILGAVESYSVEQTPNLKTMLEFGKDSLLLWWAGPTTNIELILAIPDMDWRDTVLLEYNQEGLGNWAVLAPIKAGSGKGKSSGRLLNNSKEEPKLDIHPKKPVDIWISRPIVTVDTTLVTWVKDSMLLDIPFLLRIDSSHARHLILNATLEQDMSYELQFLPGALLDFWGESNSDTLRFSYRAMKIEELGNISAKIVNADSSEQYLVQLLGEQEELLFETTMKGKTELKLEFPEMFAQRYILQVIHDTDGNNRWTNGLYSEKRQPERITRSKSINLRANWDNEMEIDLNPPSKMATGAKKGK